jgi:hypothetical protein
MPLKDRLRRAAGAPLRRYIDPRLGGIDARVAAAGSEARAELARARVDVLDELDRRFSQMAYDLAAVSRAHTESIGYVAAELSRLQTRLGDEVDALRAEVAAGPAQRRTAATDAYALRALAPLAPGARVLAVGHGLDLAPLYLAALGHRVTVLAERRYPLEHAHLEAVIGGLDDAGAGDGYDAVLLAPGAGDAAAAARRLAPGGLLVAGLPESAPGALDGLEELDRAGARRNGNGGWTLTEPQSSELLLLTARRP